MKVFAAGDRIRMSLGGLKGTVTGAWPKANRYDIKFDIDPSKILSCSGDSLTKLKKKANVHEDVAATSKRSLSSIQKRLTKPEPSLSESFRESFENPTFILSSVVVAVCAFRFLFDGVTFGLLDFKIMLDHTAPLAYSSILTPVLAGHAYIRAKGKDLPAKQKVDNPDA